MFVCTDLQVVDLDVFSECFGVAADEFINQLVELLGMDIFLVGVLAVID